MTEYLTQAIPEQSRPDAAGFDHRLMTPERQLSLAGDHALILGQDPAGHLWLDCRTCGKGISPLTSDIQKWSVRPGQLLADVLRHLVMSHGLALSGGGGE